MIRTKKEIPSEEVDVVKDIICNMCGKPCPQPGIEGQWEYATLSAHWGYGSPRDGDIDESHICPTCYNKIVSSFVIKNVCKSSCGWGWYEGGEIDFDEPVGEEPEPESHERMERLLNAPSILDESSEDDNG